MKKRTLPNSFLKDIKPLPLQGNRFLIMTDAHIPYHNKKSIEKAIQIGKESKVDSILLLGDMIDFFPISRFNKSPKNPDLQYELNATVQFLQYLRNEFPVTTITYKIGNHEDRLTKYINDHGELFSLDCLKLKSLLKFKDLGIRLVESNTIMRIGSLYLAHGHETKAGGITPAKNMLNKWHCDMAFGHLHRTDEYQFRKFDGSLIKTYSIGSLCNLYPDYWQNNNWNNGCAIATRLKEGKYDFENIRF